MAGVAAARSATGMDLERLFSALSVATGERPVPSAQKIEMTRSDEHRAVQLVKRLWQQSQEESWHKRREWALNAAYERGDFQATWSWTSKRIESKPDDTGRHRVHLNVTRPIITSWDATLLKQKPVIQVKAATQDREIVDFASTYERVLSEHEWREQDMDRLRKEIVHLLNVKGTGILKVVWDPNGGPSLGQVEIPVLGPDGQPIQRQMIDEDPESPTFGQVIPAVDEQGLPVWEVEERDGKPVLQEAFLGANRALAIDPEDFGFDGVADYEESNWSIHRYRMTQQAIWHEFEKVVERGTTTGPHDALAGLRGWLQRSFRRGAATVRRNRVFDVLECWIKPGKWPVSDDIGDAIDFPDGYVLTVAGDQLLDHGPNIQDRLPFIVGKALTGGVHQPLGETRASDVRGVQATILKTGSQLTKAHDIMANPVVFYTAGSDYEETDASSRIGVCVRWSGRREQDRPTRESGVTMPHGVYAWFDEMLKSWLPFISGVNPGGMLGSVPPNVEAAAAFIELAEKDATQLVPVALGYGLMMQEWAEHTSANHQKFWTEERMVYVGGRSTEPQVVAMSGHDVSRDFLFSVAPEALVPKSSAARIQLALTLWKMNLIRKRDALQRIGEEPNDESTLYGLIADWARRDIQAASENGEIPEDGGLLEMIDVEPYQEELVRYLLDPKADEEPDASRLVLDRAKMIHAAMQQRAVEAAAMEEGGGAAAAGGVEGGPVEGPEGEGPVAAEMQPPE